MLTDWCGIDPANDQSGEHVKDAAQHGFQRAWKAGPVTPAYLCLLFRNLVFGATPTIGEMTQKINKKLTLLVLMDHHYMFRLIIFSFCGISFL